MKKTSSAQLEADKRYREKNKEKTKINTYMRSARALIKNHATRSDLLELSFLIDQKLEENKMSDISLAKLRIKQFQEGIVDIYVKDGLVTPIYFNDYAKEAHRFFPDYFAAAVKRGDLVLRGDKIAIRLELKDGNITGKILGIETPKDFGAVEADFEATEIAELNDEESFED